MSECGWFGAPGGTSLPGTWRTMGSVLFMAQNAPLRFLVNSDDGNSCGHRSLRRPGNLCWLGVIPSLGVLRLFINPVPVKKKRVDLDGFRTMAVLWTSFAEWLGDGRPIHPLPEGI